MEGYSGTGGHWRGIDGLWGWRCEEGSGWNGDMIGCGRRRRGRRGPSGGLRGRGPLLRAGDRQLGMDGRGSEHRQGGRPRTR